MERMAGHSSSQDVCCGYVVSRSLCVVLTLCAVRGDFGASGWTLWVQTDALKRRSVRDEYRALVRVCSKRNPCAASLLGSKRVNWGPARAHRRDDTITTRERNREKPV
jgi:hypothetical protein